MRNPRTDVLAKTAILKKVIEKCKKSKQCPYCGGVNGTVKKITGAPTLKIVHEKYKGRHSEDELEQLMENLSTAMDHNKDLVSVMNGSNPPVDDLLPTKVLEISAQ